MNFPEAPSSLESEQYVLGACLVDKLALSQAVAILEPDDFHKPLHQRIYRTCKRLFQAGEAVDNVSVSETIIETEAAGLLVSKNNVRLYVSELLANTITTDAIEWHARNVYDCAIRRRVMNIGLEAPFIATSNDGKTAVEKLQQALLEIDTTRGQDRRPHGQLVSEVVASILSPNASPGIPSGLPDLDNAIGGLKPGQLAIVAGRPGMGKTAFAGCYALNAARNGHPVLFMSIEMPPDEIVKRLLANMMESRPSREKQFQLVKCAEELKRLPIEIMDTPALTVAALRAEIQRHTCLGTPPALVIVDYLQLMTSEGENRAQEVSSISRGLKQAARAYKLPIIALAQLNRGVEQRNDKRPVLSDLRESGSIEQDADLVLFLYRDEYYNPETERPGTADAIIAKQRNGPTGSVALTFNGETSCFGTIRRGVSQWTC